MGRPSRALRFRERADRLIAKDMIVRRANASDGRFQSLALTRRGRAITPQLAALADENDAEFFADIDIETRERIATALKDVVRVKRLRGAPGGLPGPRAPGGARTHAKP